jgi:anti-sigma-K factor RskA
MSDDLPGAHQPWDELVAGQALHALEPAEELRLVAHVGSCPRCRAALDDFTLVAAQLGSLADEEERPPSWRKLRPRVVAPPGAVASTTAASVAVLEPRRSRRVSLTTRALTAAAAAAVIAAGLATGWQLTRPSGDNPANAALTACRQQSGCRVIQLHGENGDSAAVLVDAGRASLVPLRMPSPGTGQMYVLWQLPRDGSPMPVVAFLDPKQQTGSVPLTTDYADTAAFAVSLEPAGAVPIRPTDVLTVGAAAETHGA